MERFDLIMTSYVTPVVVAVALAWTVFLLVNLAVHLIRATFGA